MTSTFVYPDWPLLCSDVSDPTKFLVGLIRARFPGRVIPFGDDDWLHAVQIVDGVHPVIFDVTGGEDIPAAVWRLCLGLSDLVEIEGSSFHSVPKAWLLMFAEAFERGLINTVAWGAALRCVLTLHGDGECPDWYEPSNVLAALRTASPQGLMLAHEEAIWRALPETVTIYRGGCANSVYARLAVAELTRGLHWSLSPDVAATYLRARSYARRDDPTAGLPVIVKAEVPRELILAYCNRNGEQELFVDFEGIAPGMVTDLGAVNYLPPSSKLAA